jgi:hypothetical protein
MSQDQVRKLALGFFAIFGLAMTIKIFTSLVAGSPNYDCYLRSQALFPSWDDKATLSVNRMACGDRNTIEIELDSMVKQGQIYIIEQIAEEPYEYNGLRYDQTPVSVQWTSDRRVEVTVGLDRRSNEKLYNKESVEIAIRRP